MVLKQIQTYQLVPRGGPGLACDGEGIFLGGLALGSVSIDEEGQRACRVRPTDQLRQILSLAYGPQSEHAVLRCQRGLHRVAARLDAGDLALAGIEAVMLRLPTVNADRLAKLSSWSEIEKSGSSWENEPRIPKGQSGGGQWTTGDGGGAGSTPRPRLPSGGSQRLSGEGPSEPGEVTVPLRVRQSKTEDANGFYPNSAGGGLLYIPSVSNGRPIRSTEVHVVDASAFRVGWTADTITLKDQVGHLYSVAASDLAHFNATTGKILGIAIYAHPDQPLGPWCDEPTLAEQQQLAQDRARLAGAERAWENSPGGRAIGMAVAGEAALPLVALVPAALSSAVPRLYLNTLDANELPIFLARRLGLEAERAVGITGPKVAIEIPGTKLLRVPDAVDKLAKVLTEVKNVAKLRMTPQLRDYLAFCRAEGYRFVLYTA